MRNLYGVYFTNHLVVYYSIINKDLTKQYIL